MSKKNRWKQRFELFQKSNKRLKEAIERTDDLNDELLRAGLIQTFEFNFELGWKTLKDYLNGEGLLVSSPRDVIKQAFQENYIENAEVWIKALEDRNKTSHLYDENIAIGIAKNIQTKYINLFNNLEDFLNEKHNE